MAIELSFSFPDPSQLSDFKNREGSGSENVDFSVHNILTIANVSFILVFRERSRSIHHEPRRRKNSRRKVCDFISPWKPFVCCYVLIVAMVILYPACRRQAYNEHKLDRWRECEEKLDDFLKDLKDRLDKVSEKPRDRDDIKKKLKDAKVSTTMQYCGIFHAPLFLEHNVFLFQTMYHCFENEILCNR